LQSRAITHICTRYIEQYFLSEPDRAAVLVSTGSSYSSSDKVYELLAHDRWFSLGTPASSTTKTGRHDIAKKLLKVAINTKINQ
jgi:hypothetical protein